MKIQTGANNPLLRQPSGLISQITPDLENLVTRMFETLKKAQGIGLSAPQVGKNLRLFIVDQMAFENKEGFSFKKINPDLKQGCVFINPKLLKKSRKENILPEGCLSLPETIQKNIPVPRAKKLTLWAQDISGKPFKLYAKGLLARVIQHEMDHLKGRLIIDYIKK